MAVELTIARGKAMALIESAGGTMAAVSCSIADGTLGRCVSHNDVSLEGVSSTCQSRFRWYPLDCQDRYDLCVGNRGEIHVSLE